MSDALSVTEAALLARDQPVQPWQQAFVLVLDQPISRMEIIDLIAARIGYAPRFRRVPGGLGPSTWVDDPDFSPGGHVRELRLAPGQRLEDWLSARLATPIDPAHPLWEAVLVHGLAPDRVALVVRSHPALVDGYDHVHLLQELLDEAPAAVAPEPGEWTPEPAGQPGLGDLFGGLSDPAGLLGNAAARLTGLVENVARGAWAAPRQQFVAGVEIDFDQLAAIRRAFDCTTHDVLLALATGGVRGWLAAQPGVSSDPVALVPMAVTEPDVLASAIGCRVAPAWLALPVTAPSAVERLAALATMTRARTDTGISVRARDLTDLAGFAAPTLHAVAAGTVAAGRPHQVLIADVPGPRRDLFLGPVRVRQVYAVTATTDDQRLAVAITSYRDRVSFGAAAVAPLGQWAADVTAELRQLLAAVAGE